jgi:hypothetical protein
LRISDLILSYRTDKASAYPTLRFRTRQHYDSLLRRIEADLGAREVAEVRTRDITLTHQLWSLRGVHMAHALIGMLRTLCNYGGTILEDDACITLAGRMGAMRFKMGKPRQIRITADQVVAVRAMAHDMGYHAIALAQAFQFDLMLRQRDVIGEWIPETEPGESDVRDGNGWKWLRGIRWSEIDDKLILRHVTSKRQKEIEVDLTLAPMVMAELRFEHLIVAPSPETRHRIRSGGPIIVQPETGLPYSGHEFRRLWRLVARAAGVPDNTFNMDSRAGAISEATDAGASLELVRHAATHSDVATTARYSRGSTGKIAEVMRLRAEARR